MYSSGNLTATRGAGAGIPAATGAACTGPCPTGGEVAGMGAAIPWQKAPTSPKEVSTIGCRRRGYEVSSGIIPAPVVAVLSEVTHWTSTELLPQLLKQWIVSHSWKLPFGWVIPLLTWFPPQGGLLVLCFHCLPHVA